MAACAEEPGKRHRRRPHTRKNEMTMGLPVDRDGYELRLTPCRICGSRGCPEHNKCQPEVTATPASPVVSERERVLEEAALIADHVVIAVIPDQCTTRESLKFQREEVAKRIRALKYSPASSAPVQKKPLKLNIDPEWCLAAAEREGDSEVGAGYHSLPKAAEALSVSQPVQKASDIAKAIRKEVARYFDAEGNDKPSYWLIANAFEKKIAEALTSQSGEK
jgi:hypothetical protein